MYQLNDIDHDMRTAAKRTAAMRASERNKLLASDLPHELRDKHEQLYELVRSAYIACKQPYKNYNVHTVQVKVDRPRARDVITADRDRALSTFCQQHAVIKRTVGANVIYHIPRDTIQ